MKRSWSWHLLRRGLRLGMICAPLIVGGCEESPDALVTPAASTDRRQPAPIALSATIVQPATIPQQLAARRADRRWETTAAMPETLIEPTKAFVNYLLNDVGDEFAAAVADPDDAETSPTSTAEANRSHLRNLKDLHYVWRQFNDGCGPLRRISSLTYKTSYAGEYVEAKCIGERDTRLIRLTFDKHDGGINGCLLANEPAAPTYPPTVYARTNAQCGYIFRFFDRICSLALDVRVVEDGDLPRRLNCSFDIWLRAHPFYFGAVSAEPHVQDREGYLWRRVNTYNPYVRVNHDLNRYRIEGLQPGTYRVTARVRGCPGSLVSPELFLDGSQQETNVVIPLRWAKSVEVVVRDPRSNRRVDGDDLQLFLGGWSWRAWRVSPWERKESYWNGSRYTTDQLRFQDGRFSLGKIPAGEYVLGFNPPAECRLFDVSKPPKEIVLNVQAAANNKFVLATDMVRRFINWNFDMCVDWNLEEFKNSYHIEDLIQPATVALLGFCERREAHDALYYLMRLRTPAPLRLAAVRAIVRHDDLQDRILPRAAHLLALVNAQEQPVEFAPPCVEILRRANDGVTAASARAASVDMPDDIRRLVIDLGSHFPALRVYAARRLESEGKRAAPAIPFLRIALADDRFEWPADDELLIDFTRVSDAARRALNAIVE